MLRLGGHAAAHESVLAAVGPLGAGGEDVAGESGYPVCDVDVVVGVLRPGLVDVERVPPGHAVRHEEVQVHASARRLDDHRRGFGQRVEQVFGELVEVVHVDDHPACRHDDGGMGVGVLEFFPEPADSLLLVGPLEESAEFTASVGSREELGGDESGPVESSVFADQVLGLEDGGDLGSSATGHDGESCCGGFEGYVEVVLIAVWHGLSSCCC